MGKKMAPTPAAVVAPAVGAHPYKMQVPKSFLIISFTIPPFLAYIVGCAARMYLLQHSNLQHMHMTSAVLHPEQQQEQQLLFGADSDTNQVSVDTVSLPLPMVSEDKEVPLTVFTSRNFAVDNVRSSNTMHIQPRRSSGARNSNVMDENNESEQVLHEPAGQHLLVDIKHVNSDFLDSEQRLALAMVELVAESGLTLLSYHCHSMIPAGVSCVGVLLESHVSFHTWPAEGVITLDLFTCGPNPLLPAMPMIERLFAIPQTGEAFIEKPRLLWSHKMRGFRKKESILENDSSLMVLDHMEFDYKTLVGSTRTIYQHIDIYDFINPRFNDLHSYEKSLSNDGSYEAENSELYKMNRLILLDGVMQSCSDGDEAYHESLVHPAMFAHPNPRRAAIIGGGEGATLREVLKHNTIETVKMIDIDDEMMQFSRKHLPSWSDCSDIVGSTDCCFDDPRADVYALDAMAWFLDRFADTCLLNDGDECSDKSSTPTEDPFDVIIMDALDPQDDVAFADVLYANTAFWKSLYDALTPDGILVMQLGISPDSSNPPDYIGKNRRRAELIAGLEGMNFKSMYAYEDGHSGFQDAWSYLLACKSEKCRSSWMKNEAEVELAIHKRTVRTHSGKPALKYFDGSMMQTWKYFPRAWETVFCKVVPAPEACRYTASATSTKRISMSDEVLIDNTGLESVLYNRKAMNNDHVLKWKKWLSSLKEQKTLSHGDMNNMMGVNANSNAVVFNPVLNRRFRV